MLVQKFQLGELTVGINLVGGGDALVYLDGRVGVVCPRGRTHEYEVDAEIRMTAEVCRHELEPLEWAIRGRAAAASELANLLVVDLQRRVWGDPCTGVREGV